jgi:hypothetical protein
MRNGLRERTSAYAAPDRETDSRLFSERRLLWGTAAATVVCAAITIMLWPALHSGQAGGHCLDFNWIWLTGKLAVSHAATQVYHPGALSPEIAALPEFQCTGTQGDGAFSYPPTILFFTYPLGFLSYPGALAAWNAATLILYLVAVYAILPRTAAVLAALTTYPVAINLVIGHNGFLSAGLFGLALVAMERRPQLAGVFLGLLTYKPHLGVLFPLGLLASRNWRALVAASVATVGFGAAAAIAFGHDLWPAFFTGIIEARARVDHSHSVSNVIFPTALGLLRHFDVGLTAAWIVQGVVSAAAAVAVWVVWSRPIPHALKAAAIAIASLLVTPYALTYDYCILSMAAAFLVKDGLARGFLRGERATLLLCWSGLSLFAFLAGLCLGASTGDSGLGGELMYLLCAAAPMLICAILLGQIFRRAFWGMPNTTTAATGDAENTAIAAAR